MNSHSRSIRGISAAAIMAILAGAAYGQLADDLKATKSNSLDNSQNVSAILGGTGNIVGGFASFVPVYNRGEANFAATLGVNGSSYGDGKLVDDVAGSWSILVAVKPSAQENNGIIWSTGRFHAGLVDGHVEGLALIQKNPTTLQLVKWQRTQVAASEGVEASDTSDASTILLDNITVKAGYQTVIVTHNADDDALAAYVDGTSAATGTADLSALDKSGFQFGKLHGDIPTGLAGANGILMDEAGVWTAKCLTAEEAKTVADEYEYSDVVVHTITVNADSNWSAVKPAEIGENDIIEIVSASKTLTFDEEVTLDNPVVLKSGLMRILGLDKVTVNNTFTVAPSATLRIDPTGIDLATEVSFADSLVVQGGLELTNVGSAGGGTRNHNKTDKRIIAQKIVFDGGSLSLGDGSVYFKGDVSVAAGKTSSMTVGWAKAWIFDSLTVPATSTLNFTNNIGSDGSESILDILGGEVAGTLNVTSKSSSTGTLAVFPTTACASATINLNGATLVGGDTAETALTLAGNVTATHVNNGANVAGTRGHVTLNGKLRTLADTTFTVGAGRFVVTKTTDGSNQNRGLGGHVVIAQNATLALQCNDAINYNAAAGKSTLTINGTLEGGTNRQSFGANNAVILGAGATITGDGGRYADENYSAVLDFFADQSITVAAAGAVNLNGAIGIRNNKTLTITRAEGVEGEVIVNVGKQIVGGGAVVLDSINKLWDLPGKFMPAVGKKLTVKNSTGHFASGVTVDGTLTIDGSFTVVNGYTGDNKAITLKKLVGTSEASIVDGIAAVSGSATPIVYVQDWTEWKGTVSYPENKKLTVNFSRARSNRTASSTWFYDIDAAKAEVLGETYEVTNIDFTEAELAAAGLTLDGTRIVKAAISGWDAVTEETDLFDLLKDLGLSAYGAAFESGDVTSTMIKNWAVANKVAFGTEFDVEAFALNVAPGEAAEEAKKLVMSIEIDSDGQPVPSYDEDAVKNWNIKPTIQGSVDLKNWGGTSRATFFRAIVNIFKYEPGL